MPKPRLRREWLAIVMALMLAVLLYCVSYVALCKMSVIGVTTWSMNHSRFSITSTPAGDEFWINGELAFVNGAAVPGYEMHRQFIRVGTHGTSALHRVLDVLYAPLYRLDERWRVIH